MAATASAGGAHLCITVNCMVRIEQLWHCAQPSTVLLHLQRCLLSVARSTFSHALNICSLASCSKLFSARQTLHVMDRCPPTTCSQTFKASFQTFYD